MSGTFLTSLGSAENEKGRKCIETTCDKCKATEGTELREVDEEAQKRCNCESTVSSDPKPSYRGCQRVPGTAPPPGVVTGLKE